MVSRARINPKMMKWAREYAGFINGYEDSLPKEIKDKIDYWENGERYPTWNQLRAVSKKFNVPSAFFFMKSTPSFEDLPNLINYRKIDNNSISDRVIVPYPLTFVKSVAIINSQRCE